MTQKNVFADMNVFLLESITLARSNLEAILLQKLQSVIGLFKEFKKMGLSDLQRHMVVLNDRPRLDIRSAGYQ